MFPLQTDYFHLFICVAIVVIYGDDVIEQQLATDQMLLHFGNLAMHMNGELVLRKVNAQVPMWDKVQRWVRVLRKPGTAASAWHLLYLCGWVGCCCLPGNKVCSRRR